MPIPPVNTTPRTCAKCGQRPAGPGRVLCTECKTAIEQANPNPATKCGKPGRLYPVTPADRDRLLTGPASAEFFRATMEFFCDDHAPGDVEVAVFFTDRSAPCEARVPPAPPTGTFQ